MGTLKQQRPHPDRRLEQRKAHQDEAAGDELRRFAAKREPARLQDRGEHHGIAEHAVIELHGERVLEQVQIPG